MPSLRFLFSTAHPPRHAGQQFHKKPNNENTSWKTSKRHYPPPPQKQHKTKTQKKHHNQIPHHRTNKKLLKNHRTSQKHRTEQKIYTKKTLKRQSPRNTKYRISTRSTHLLTEISFHVRHTRRGECRGEHAHTKHRTGPSRLKNHPNKRTYPTREKYLEKPYNSQTDDTIFKFWTQKILAFHHFQVWKPLLKCIVYTSHGDTLVTTTGYAAALLSPSNHVPTVVGYV